METNYTGRPFNTEPNRMSHFLLRHARRVLATFPLAVLMTACGGGDSFSDPSMQTATSSSSAAIAGGDADSPGARLKHRNAQVPGKLQLFDAIEKEFARLEAEQSDVLRQVWGGDNVVYAPGGSTQLLVPASTGEATRTFTLLMGNGGESFAVAGKAQASRVAAFGSNLINDVQAASAPTMLAPTRRLLSWLLFGTQQDISSARTISLIRYSPGEQIVLKKWFKAQYPAWTVTSCDDEGQLGQCTQRSQLLLVGSNAAARNNANAALLGFLDRSLAAGKPLLYQHAAGWGDGGLPQIADLLGVAPLPYGGNYFTQDSANWASQEAMFAGPMQAMKRLVNHLAANDYTFDLSQCPDDNRCGSMPGITTEFYRGAEQLQAWIGNMERSGKQPFDTNAPALLKQLVELGDHYRRAVRFPMSKHSTPVNTFMQALFADYALTSGRREQPAINLEGSSYPGVPSGVASVSANRNFSVRSVEYTSSAAVYALPGRSFTVKRIDNSTAKVAVFVNQMHSDASYVFGKAYDRPKYLSGNAVPLEPGKSIVMNHPYGGLVYVRMQKSDKAADVRLQFNGVGQHAVYNGPASGANFATQLSSSPLGWAEILTPSFELHSTSVKMRDSIARYHGDVQHLLGDFENYIYRDIYNLAGFSGRDLALTPGVKAFCQQKGWDCSSPSIHGLVGIQHFNVDRTECGLMCAGQPIDSNDPFDPLGWGESHEVGHNLQYDHLRLYDGQSREVSNNIFPVHKWLQYNRANPAAQQYGRDLQQRATFDSLQEGQRHASPVDFVKDAIWFNEDLFWGRLMFYWQVALDNRAALGDEGWDLYRLLYLHDRLLTQAQESDAKWETERTKLGFGNAAFASRSTVQNITAEDYMLVVISHITRRDQRRYFDMWGIKYSAAAAAQVASFGYPATSKRFWVIPCESKGFKAPLAQPVAVDGQSTWPAVGNCTP